MIYIGDITLRDAERAALEAGIESATLDRKATLHATEASWGGADKVKNRFSPGTHGHHEAYDRASVLMSVWNDFILEHPSVAMCEDAYRLAYIAMHFMIATYQTLACQEPESPTESVTISRKEYDELIEETKWLEDLRAAGVDNWQGFDEACRMRRERRTMEEDERALQYDSIKSGKACTA